MKAISIHQPFASLIVDPAHKIPFNMPRKRVENRSWASPIVGEVILIHASKTTVRLKSLKWPWQLQVSMPLGALVGTAVIRACIRYEPGKYFDFAGKSTLFHKLDLADFAWVNIHAHSEGPVCWVLDKVTRFREPIRYVGAQGFFNVPTPLVAKAVNEAEAVNPKDLGTFL